VRLLPILLACAALLLCAGTAQAASVEVYTEETGRITSYYEQFWVVNVNGTISITNPSDRDLYEVSVRYDLGTLTLIELSPTNYFRGGQFIVPRIPANSSVTARYSIVGISVSEPTLIDKGVLHSAMAKFTPVIYSDTFGSLQKANLEDASYTGRPGRLISVELRNPTGFQYTIVSLTVFKTPQLDPNAVLDSWSIVNSSSPVMISPDAIFVHDLLDRNSAEGLVYWLAADVYISQVDFVDFSNVTRFTEYNLTVPPEFLNYTVNESNETNASLLSSTEVYAKKMADRQLVTIEEPVTLSLLVTNFAQRLFTFQVLDELPPGFVFVSGDGWSEEQGKLIYRGTLGGKTAAVVSYSAMLTDASAAGFDYFASSQVDYSDERSRKTVYSDTVPFIRQYLPQKRIYVQKRLRYEDKDQVSVTISVQNLGGGAVNGLLLKEYLQDDDLFSAITEQPLEKGLWEIRELGAGQQWEVSYVTSRSTQLNVLPGLYGVPGSEVLKSLVLENIISTAWVSVRMALLEMLGIALLLGLPVVYYFVRRKT
jgi:hypothetical protein